MVLLNFGIHNFLKENNLGISKQNITEELLKFIHSKVLEFEDVDVKHAVQQFVFKENGNLLTTMSKALKKRL